MSNFEVAISVNANNFDRIDKPIEVQLDSKIFAENGNNLKLIEVDATGTVIQEAVAFQLDAEADGKRTLTFLMSGLTTAQATRYYRLHPAGTTTSVTPQIEVVDGVMYEEQESYQIKTLNATYYYHKLGAGFASMIDTDGNDWLSFHPYGGSDGIYRGIPNLVHPENHFHAGATNCNSRIVNNGALKVTIYSESYDGNWACQWDIFANYARLTVLKVDHPYWFLYEGTPGGVLDQAGDYSMRSNGVRLPLTERWAEAIPEPEWIYFGASNCERILYLVHHEADNHIDSYWSMENNMTVFGFGRNGIDKFMTETPTHFTVGFGESGEFAVAQKIINSAYRPLQITTKVS